MSIGLCCDEEATKGTVGERTEDCSAPLDNDGLQRIGSCACDPGR